MKILLIVLFVSALLLLSFVVMIAAYLFVLPPVRY